jgi:hypothetical protein
MRLCTKLMKYNGRLCLSVCPSVLVFYMWHYQTKFYKILYLLVEGMHIKGCWANLIWLIFMKFTRRLNRNSLVSILYKN